MSAHHFAYYNEIEPQAREWLCELMNAGLIPQGFVDDRSIVEVLPADLHGFTQHHFFAGIGGWSRALRLAGWPDDRPVWTGSCPCQPFSAAGKGAGFDDARHLWPVWERLIRECRPARVFGEQVASKAGLMWFDLVHADLENAGYAVGAADLCAAGIGAPHIRQRLYFGAHRLANPSSERIRATGSASIGSASGGMPPANWQRERIRDDVGERSAAGAGGGLANSERPATDARRSAIGPSESIGAPDGRAPVELGRRGDTGRLDHSASTRHDDSREHGGGSPLFTARPEQSGGAGSVGLGDPHDPRPQGRVERAGASPGELPARAAEPPFWNSAVYIPCLDDRARPVEPGIFPLAVGVPGRVVLLRGAGNAIVPPVAQAFIEEYEAAVEWTGP